MPTIVPAILESDTDVLEDRISQALKIPGATRFQIDFSDGKFTPYKTVSVSEVPVLNPEFDWEAHLMLENPQDYFLDAKITGFTTVIVHYEVVPKNLLADLAAQLKQIGISPALGIIPETSISEVEPFFRFFEQVLLLGVHPGKQGQELLPDTIQRLNQIKAYADKIKIEVDGGVNENNISAIVETGVDFIVVGSDIFKPAAPEIGLDEESENSPERKYEDLSSFLT